MSTSALKAARQNPFGPARPRRDFSRRVINGVAIGFSSVCALLAAGFLIYVLVFVAKQGSQFLNVDFFTQPPAPYGNTGGGVQPALIGTCLIVGIAALVGIPLGLLTGVYLSEFGGGPFASVVRFMVDMLTGIPTIIFGLFIWVLIVVPSRSFSGISGGIALSIIMIPIVARATEEVLRLVPNELREASAALGATESRTIWSVVLPSARTGIITGIMLAGARAAGETAPLLLTAFGSQFASVNIFRPMAALPLQVYLYTLSPYDAQIHQAYAGAFVLMLLVILASLAVRWATGGFKSR
jgi:phosphate transport system permease protein